jgi:hypothetical protein
MADLHVYLGRCVMALLPLRSLVQVLTQMPLPERVIVIEFHS